MLGVLACSRVYVFACSRALRAWRACALTCLRASVLGVLACLACLRAWRACVRACIVVTMKCLIFLRVCVLGILCAFLSYLLYISILKFKNS